MGFIVLTCPIKNSACDLVAFKTVPRGKVSFDLLDLISDIILPVASSQSLCIITNIKGNLR